MRLGSTLEKAYMLASANGTLPAHARQIMYQARPLIQADVDKPLDDQYFCQTLLPDYMEENDVDWDVVWDDRGHFTEPHTERVIGLGTIAVRDYLDEITDLKWIEPQLSEGKLETHGPDGRYSAILFVEKEGFVPLFQAVQLAERFDIALMSSKGMSNTAARRLVDELAKLKVPLLVLHDFDKSGLSILGTFKRATRRYTFENKIEVIDLGLRLADVRRLRLTKETAFDRGSQAARALNLKKNGATAAEIEFLLQWRVELNAMPSDMLVAFIERKLRAHGIKKVIPNQKMLAESYRNNVKAREIEEAIEEALAEADSKESKVAVPRDLAAQVAKYLEENPAEPWDAAVAAICKK
jgi:hypothetical protein